VNRQALAQLVRDRFVFVRLATIGLWGAWIGQMATTGFTRDIEGKPIGTDHVAFYSAGRLIGDGQGERIYDIDFLWHYQPSLVNYDGLFLDAYRNPPFYALLYVPTARLPYLVSFWIWTIVSLVMLWFGLGWLGSANRLEAFIFSVSFYPVFATFSFGQNSLLSFGLFCLTFRALDGGRPLLAGIVSGLLLYKPQLLLGLGLWWMLSFSRYWKCLLGVALTGLFWLALSLILVPAETRLFVEKLKEIAAYDAFEYWNLHNPRGFGALIADDKLFGVRVGLVCLLAAVGVYLNFWRRHRDNMPVMFAGAVFLTLWASPHTMIYEWSLVLIPAVLLWERVPNQRDDWVLMFALSWVVLFISTFIAKTLMKWTGGWAIQISVPVLAVVGIWAMRVLRTESSPPLSKGGQGG
jgi:alpha-1,2-mannosyltransferase